MRKAYWYLIGLAMAVIVGGNIIHDYNGSYSREESVWIPQNFSISNVVNGEIISIARADSAIEGRKIDSDGFEKLFADKEGEIIVDTGFSFFGNYVDVYYIATKNGEKYLYYKPSPRIGADASIKVVTEKSLKINFERNWIKVVIGVIVLTILELILIGIIIYGVVKSIAFFKS